LSSDDISQRGIEHQLHCDSHDFHHPNFLEERLKQSDELLNIVLRSIQGWSNDHYANKYEATRLKTGFLWNTSWRYKHNKHEHYYADDLTILIESLENALKYRSLHNDKWWSINEPNLRTIQDVALRHITIQAYKENIGANLLGVKVQLTDKELYFFNKINYELGELMQLAYPYISADGIFMVANQAMVLSLYDDYLSEPDVDNFTNKFLWCNRDIYDLLIRIPSIFRSLETKLHISKWQDYFSYNEPLPNIHSRSWTGVAPVSKEDFLRLSNESILRLLHYYDQFPNEDSFEFDSTMVGGLSTLKNPLSEASSLHPIRFLDLLPHFAADSLHQSYIHAVIEGAANHLRCRFGNLSLNSGDGWKPIDPLPDGTMLAAKLLNLLERYPTVWNDARTASNALKACCDVLEDTESAERLTILLFWIRSKIPEHEKNTNSNSETDLVSRFLNSSLGVAAESSIKLCNCLLKNDQPLPELLPYLLHSFARDSTIYPRIPILEHLPFLMYKLPSLGWQLLAEVFQEPQPNLWKYAERSLYHQYQSHFYKVAPYLERLMKEGMEEAGDVWGRISTLASLAGYISQEELFESLAKANTKAWKGSVQVFAANLNRREHREVCHSGLIYILKQENLSDEVIREIDQCFDKEANRGFIRHDLVSAFLNALSISAGSHDIFKFLEWLGREARYNPLFYLEIIETLVDKLERKLLSGQIWHTEPLIIALNEILREADESDDPKIIHRAINLQDHFLRLGINGIEEMIAKAEQS